MIKEKTVIEEELLRLRKLLSYNKRNLTRDDGSILVVSKKGEFYSQLQKDGKTLRRYIRKKDKVEIERLLKKGLKRETCRVLENNIRLLEKISGKYKPYDMISIIAEMSEAYKQGFSFVQPELKASALLFPEASQIDIGEFERLSQIKYNVFNAKTYYPDALSHFTAKGEARRSRVEVIISNIYDSMGISYIYEPTLRWDFFSENEKADALKHKFGIPDSIIPDFMFPMGYNPPYFHEHLGLRELEEYNENWSKKELFYYLNDIRLGSRLLVTSDTHDGNVNSDEVYEIAKKIKHLQERNPVI